MKLIAISKINIGVAICECLNASIVAYLSSPIIVFGRKEISIKGIYSNDCKNLLQSLYT